MTHFGSVSPCPNLSSGKEVATDASWFFLKVTEAKGYTEVLATVAGDDRSKVFRCPTSLYPRLRGNPLSMPAASLSSNTAGRLRVCRTRYRERQHCSIPVPGMYTCSSARGAIHGTDIGAAYAGQSEVPVWFAPSTIPLADASWGT